MDLSILPESVKLALYLFVIFYSNVVQALTGFAGVMLSIPPLILIYGPDTSKAVIGFLSWLICLFISWQNRRYIDWHEVRHIVMYMLIGMAAGVFLYRHMDASILIPFYGALIIAVALKNLLLKPSNRILPEWLFTVILLGAGIIHGLFVSGGALLVIYLAAKFREKNVFRATVAAVWSILNVFLLFSDWEKGLYTPDLFFLAVIGIIPLVIALWTGNKIHEQIDQYMFRRVTYGLLFLAGAMILL